MSPAASCKSRADLRNSGLSNITQVHNIINPVNNTKASETLIFFPLQNSLMLLHDCYKGSSLPCNPGPHSSCACNSSWLHMHSSRYRAPTTHTQKLWSEINLKGFFSSFWCASRWLEAILYHYFCYTVSVNNIDNHKYSFSHQEVKLLSSGKELMLATCLFILTALLLFPCEDQKWRQKGQIVCTK